MRNTYVVARGTWQLPVCVEGTTHTTRWLGELGLGADRRHHTRLTIVARPFTATPWIFQVLGRPTGRFATTSLIASFKSFLSDLAVEDLTGSVSTRAEERQSGTT